MLKKWNHDFSSLLNGNVQSSANEEIPSSASVRDQDVSFFEQNISILEVKNAVEGTRRGKACGIDHIPSEVFKNDVTVCFDMFYSIFALIRGYSQGFGENASLNRY